MCKKIPEHINEMEAILDEANARMDALEKAIEEFREIQPRIRKLEEYYASQQWKDDFSADENGEFPDNLKRGVLSEDGIYDMLERNGELLEMLGE